MCFKKLEVVVITVDNIFSPDYLFDHTVVKFESRCVRYQETKNSRSLILRRKLGGLLTGGGGGAD